MDYFHFITRPLPLAEVAGPTGYESIPDFLSKSIFWSAFFVLLNILVPLILKNVFTRWYASLDPRKRHELPSFVVCLVHHFAMVPTAWLHIYNDYQLTPAQAAVVHYGPIEAVVAPFCIGYLVGDTLCFAIQEALALKFEYIIHHTLTLWLVVSTLFSTGGLNRFIPHLLICDTTNIFFNTAWLMRTVGMKGHPIVTTLEILFAVAFLFTRVINMPAVFFMISVNSEASALGYARYTLAPIAMLQWYWFSKIATTLVQRLSGGSGGGDKHTKKSKKSK